MSDLQAQFNEWVERVKNGNVSFQPTQEQKLQLYALFKQAEEGDVTGEKPPMTDFVARAKFIAREKVKGLSKEEAMKRYIEILNQ
jgi:acyl-CoA-binding protein